jgi:ATP-dependent helicase/nuclease subunit A
VRQFFPPELQRLFDDQLRSEVTESLCVLYVAMTRAIHALHLLVPPAKANERSLPKTFGGLLRAALAEGKPAVGGAVLYEQGDAQWWRTLPAGDKGELVNDGTRSVPATIALAPPLARRERGLERTSPSALEGGTRVPAAFALRAKSAIALNTGTLIHAWLEQIEWLDDGLPSDAALRAVADKLRPEIGDFSSHLDTLLARFRQQLAAPAIAAALKRSYYSHHAGADLQVFRERQFAVRLGDELLDGSIDRLVHIRQRGRLIAADILDFKTDELPVGHPAALAEKLDFYRPQLEAYRSAAAQFLKLDPRHMTARLVFLTAGLVQTIR